MAYGLWIYGDPSQLNSLTADMTDMSITQMDSTLYWSVLHLAVSFVILLSLPSSELNKKKEINQVPQ